MSAYMMGLERLVYDDSANTLTLYLRTLPPSAPPPAGVPTSNWYPQPGSVLTLDLPAKKLPSVTVTGMSAVADATAAGGVAYYLYTWNGSAYANPVRCNPDGTTPYRP